MSATATSGSGSSEKSGSASSFESSVHQLHKNVYPILETKTGGLVAFFTQLPKQHTKNTTNGQTQT